MTEMHLPAGSGKGWRRTVTEVVVVVVMVGLLTPKTRKWRKGPALPLYKPGGIRLGQTVTNHPRSASANKDAPAATAAVLSCLVAARRVDAAEISQLGEKAPFWG